MNLAWFSAGVSSAVATKILSKEIDRIIYIHIEDQHPDTMRFIKDCEKWFEKPVEILQSEYKSVDKACRAVAYVNGVRGASCTRILKRRVRAEFESDIKEHITYIWGMDSTEEDRAKRLIERNPKQTHLFPLIDKGIDVIRPVIGLGVALSPCVRNSFPDHQKRMKR